MRALTDYISRLKGQSPKEAHEPRYEACAIISLEFTFSPSEEQCEHYACVLTQIENEYKWADSCGQRGWNGSSVVSHPVSPYHHTKNFSLTPHCGGITRIQLRAFDKYIEGFGDRIIAVKLDKLDRVHITTKLRRLQVFLN